MDLVELDRDVVRGVGKDPDGGIVLPVVVGETALDYCPVNPADDDPVSPPRSVADVVIGLAVAMWTFVRAFLTPVKPKVSMPLRRLPWVTTFVMRTSS